MATPQQNRPIQLSVVRRYNVKAVRISPRQYKEIVSDDKREIAIVM